MILKGPTGLWKNQLPTKLEDNRSVTFTISNQPPPPMTDLFIAKIPNSVIKRPLPIPENKILDSADRRALFGKRIKSIVVGRQIHVRDGKKLFEPGESIEFVDDTDSIKNPLSLEEVAINHNTNLLDLKEAGLTDEEIQEIEDDAERNREVLRNSIADKQTQLDIKSAELSKVQRRINELTKISNSLIIIYSLDGSVPSGNEKYDKIYSNLQQSNSDKKTIIDNINSLNSEIFELKNKLIRMSEVIR